MDQLPFRVQNIFNQLFSPQAQQQDNTQPQMGQMNEPQLTAGFNNSTVPQDDIVKSLFQNQTDANDRLIEMMSKQPQHDQYKPNFGQKLVGGLISMNDPRQGQAYLNRGYDNAMQDWQGQLKPLGELADAERSQNTNNRLIGSGVLKDQQAQERVDATKRGQDITAETADKNRAQKDSFKAYLENKAMNPGDKLSEDADGLVFSFNPVTKVVTYLKGEDGGPIHSSKLPDLAKSELTQKNMLERITAQGTETRRNIGAQGDKEVLTSSRTLPDKINLKTTTPGKNTSAVQPAVKPGDERVAVINADGQQGTISKSHLGADGKPPKGYTLAPSNTQMTGVGLNLKPVVKKSGF